MVSFLEQVTAKLISTQMESQIRGQNCQRGILISKANVVTGPVKTAINVVEEHGIKIDVFLEDDLLVNIAEHNLVPKHEILTKEESQTLLKSYKVNENQLPRILRNDPMAKYLGLRKGDVVRIIRNSETAGKYVTYRVCD